MVAVAHLEQSRIKYSTGIIVKTLSSRSASLYNSLPKSIKWYRQTVSKSNLTKSRGSGNAPRQFTVETRV